MSIVIKNVPSYFWVLKHRCQVQIEKLREIANTRTLILLDYNTNSDINDPSTPLSHASLIKKYIEEGA